MKTILPSKITNIEEAQAFLKSLYENGESYHPEDDAADILGENDAYLFTPEEAQTVNDLMEQVCELEGFDPCEYILDLQE